MDIADYKAIQKQTGLTLLHYIVNSDGTSQYNNLTSGSSINEEHVKEQHSKLDVILTNDGKIKGLEAIPEEANSLCLSVGNAHMEKDGEHCDAFYAEIK
jgi:hypothetical protein